MYRLFKSRRLRITGGGDEAALRENLGKEEGEEGAFDSLFVFRRGSMRLGNSLRITESFDPCHVISLETHRSGERLEIKVKFSDGEIWAGLFNPESRQGILELQLPLRERIASQRFIKPILVFTRTWKLRRLLMFGYYRWAYCRKVLLDTDEGFDPIEGPIVSYRLKGNQVKMLVEERFEGKTSKARASIRLSDVLSWGIQEDGSLVINETRWITTLRKRQKQEE